MFQSLSQKLLGALNRLRSRGILTEEDVKVALREIRIALLEGDVALPVVKDFIARVGERAIGQEVIQSVTPGQMMVKIVHDELVALLGGSAAPLNFATQPPAVFLMVGLQGVGKTTMSAKLGRYMTQTLRKKVLMASLDVSRPAAQEQLAILGRQADVETLPIVPGENPLNITKRALQEGRLGGYDVVILDSAGRLHIDQELMAEVASVHAAANPIETLLVADAMTGQDAVKVAEDFKASLPLTGLLLTRLDGDARGGAALSLHAVTGCPIKFVGVGEKLEALEVFSPDRMAGRILDMGDIVAFAQKAAETIDQQEAEKMAQKMMDGHFDMNDMAGQLRQVAKMGGMSGILKMLPGMSGAEEKLQGMGMNDKTLARQLALIGSMTPHERRHPEILAASRKRRIAAGAGRPVSELNKLLKQFEDMQHMMKKMKKLGKKGLLRQGLGALMPRR